MSEKKRRKWTGKEKLRIVLTCMQPGVEVSEVCRREGINPNNVLQLEEEAFGVGEPGVRGEAEEAERGSGEGPGGVIPAEGCDRRDHGGKPGAKKKRLSD